MKGLAHTVGNRAFIQGLVSLYCHFNFIADSDQKEATLGTVDGHFSDELIKRLRIEFFSDRANTGFTDLTLIKLLVKLFLKCNYIHTCGRYGANVLHPQLPLITILTGR